MPNSLVDLNSRPRAQFLVTTSNSGVGHAFQYAYFAGNFAAPLLMGVALWRSRAVPRWLAVLFFAGLPWLPTPVRSAPPLAPAAGRLEGDMERPDRGSKRLSSSRGSAREDGIMRLFRRTPQPAGASRRPSRGERRAAERTARAEATLARTEQQIHELADEVRRDLEGTA
jgi:hypothetical protein